MPITFTVNPEQGYYISKYAGRLSDDDLIGPWKEFLAEGGWAPGLNELADISELDGDGITLDGIMRLANFVAAILKKKSKSVIKVAVYSPDDLSFGLARTYEAVSDDSIQEVHVFREREEAEAWLTE